MIKLLIIVILVIIILITLGVLFFSNNIEKFTNSYSLSDTTNPNYNPATDYNAIQRNAIQEARQAWVNNNAQNDLMIPIEQSPTPPAANTPANTPPATPTPAIPANTPPATPTPANTPPATPTPATPTPATHTPATPTPATPTPATPTPATPTPATPTPANTPATDTTPTNIPVPVAQSGNIVDFIALMEIIKPWGAYFANNISPDNKLLDLFNRDNRFATITGQIIKNNVSGFGAKNNVESLNGTINTSIEWGANSISSNFTICSITRYTGNINNKRILTSRDATPSNDWIHGHQSGNRGIVYYNNEYKIDNTLRLTGNSTDWVVTCATNGGETPNNILINGVPSGIKTGGNGNMRLSINKIDNSSIINEMSDFAISYVIIWDTVLSANALKIVSDALIGYLETGQPLLFDMSSLTIYDKVNVLNVKTNLQQQELNNMINAANSIVNSNAVNSTNATNSIVNSNAVNSTNVANSIVNSNAANAAIDFTRIANIEVALRGNNAANTIPTDSVINLARQDDNTRIRSSICSLVAEMPKPQVASFTEELINIPITSSNLSYQSYLWCKCDGDNGINANTDECKSYDLCRRNYANNNKIDFKATYSTISSFDKEIYDRCIIAFKENFPHYLETNTANQNR